MAYDIIIVGSGVAGMTAGIILAKEGKKVLVLEQYRNPGGLMRGYKRGGSCFSTGVHSLGSLEEGQSLWRYFKYLGILEKIKLVPMDTEGFHEYSFPGKTFIVPQGQEAFQNKLIEYFPREKDAIYRFMADLKKTVNHFALYNLRSETESPLEISFLQSLASYLDALTGSIELKGILSAINPLFGIAPQETPRYIHSLVLDSFLNSAWRIDESNNSLADAMFEILQAHGGEIRGNALVEKIESDISSVKGIRLQGGEFIEAKTVIFTGHPKQLVTICGKSSLRPAFKNRLVDAPESTGNFGVAIQWQSKRCSLALRDAFLYNSWDTGRQYRQTLLSSRELPHLVYCCASPIPIGGNYSVIALCCMGAEEIIPWENSKIGKRPKNYLEAKDDLVKRILFVLKEKWPKAADNMIAIDSFSPLTFRDYTLTSSGSAYGLKKSVTKFRHSTLKATTRIPGLLLAGQSIVLPGILGTVISSVDACGIILNRRYLINKIHRKENHTSARLCQR